MNIKDIECAKDAATAILGRFNGIHIGIAITLGEKGVFWMSKTDSFHVPSVQVPVVDTSVSIDIILNISKIYIMLPNVLRGRVMRLLVHLLIIYQNYQLKK